VGGFSTRSTRSAGQSRAVAFRLLIGRVVRPFRFRGVSPGICGYASIYGLEARWGAAVIGWLSCRKAVPLLACVVSVAGAVIVHLDQGGCAPLERRELEAGDAAGSRIFRSRSGRRDLGGQRVGGRFRRRHGQGNDARPTAQVLG
jgi:hypothetical protein